MGTNNIFRTALVWGVHTAVENKQFRLELPNNSEPQGYVNLDVLGFPSLFNWNEIGFKECRVSIWLNYDRCKHPQIQMSGGYGETHLGTMPNAKQYTLNRFVGLCATGWLERETGLFIQGSGSEWITDTFARKRERNLLKSLAPPYNVAFAPERNRVGA